MKRWISVGLALGAVAAVGLGCASSGSVDKAEQKRIDQEYAQLKKEKAAVQKQKQAVFARTEKLFDKAGALEKKRKLASSASVAVVPATLPIPAKGGRIGPVEFDRKKAGFKVTEAASKEEQGISIYEIKVIPEGGGE